MRKYAGTCKGICSYSLVYKFLIQPLPLQKPDFLVHFSNAFWHENEAFPKDSSSNEVVPLLLIVAIQLIQGAKNMFSAPYVVVIKIKIFHSFRSCVFRVALVSHSFLFCSNGVVRVALVLLVSHSCRLCLALVL